MICLGCGATPAAKSMALFSSPKCNLHFCRKQMILSTVKCGTPNLWKTPGLNIIILGFALCTSWCITSKESGPSNCHQTSRRLGTFSRWNKSRDFWRSVTADVPVVSWSNSFLSACVIGALCCDLPNKSALHDFNLEHPINTLQCTTTFIPWVICNICC